MVSLISLDILAVGCPWGSTRTGSFIGRLGRLRQLEIPGVGLLLASAFVATVADAHAFKSGRCLSAWIGLVPKQNSSGGKEKLANFSKAGNRFLRQMLSIVVIRDAERNGTRRPWLVQLMHGEPTKVAAVALANKTARMVWALMTNGERYRSRSSHRTRQGARVADEVGKGGQELMHKAG